MILPKTASPRRGKKGMAMILVIWIIMVLVMASIGSVRLVVSESEQTIIRTQGSKARIMASMGIAVAANPDIKRDDPLLVQDVDGEGYEAAYYSEAAKFNINYIIIRNDDDLLRNIFMDWEMSFDEASNLIAALKDWVDEDDELTPGGAEVADYEKLGFKNFPFNRPFYTLSELQYVRGWDRVEELCPDWRDWFTIWSNGKLDVNEARPKFLALACNMDEDSVRRISEEAAGMDGMIGTSDDERKNNLGEVLDSLGIPEGGREQIQNRLTTQDGTTRIESIGHSGDQKRKMVLIIGNRTGKPALLDRYEETIQ